MQNTVQELPFSLETVSKKEFPKYHEVMPAVAARFGKPVAAQLKEIVQLTLFNPRLTVDEYYWLQLYDDRFSKIEKQSFIGLNKSRQIWCELNKPNSWVGLLDHKAAFEKALGGLGYPTTNTIAMVGGTCPGPGLRQITSVEELTSFLEQADFPLFGKPVNGMQSVGTLSIRGFCAGEALVRSDESVPVDVLFSEIDNSFPDGFLLQDQLHQDERLTSLCGQAISTARMVTLNRGQGPELFGAVMKVVNGDNVADNFWRTGNLLAPIDRSSGVLGSAVDGMGMDAVWHDQHPTSGEAIRGFELPYWDQAVHLVLRAAKFFDTAMLLGWDVALTENGPVIIEANHTPDLIMLQVANQRGLWGPELQEALEHVKTRYRNKQKYLRQKLKDEQAVAKDTLLQGVRMASRTSELESRQNTQF